MKTVTRSEILKVVRELYADGPVFLRSVQYWRPYICPYEELIELVPRGVSILDVGCGGGLFLGVSAALGRISQGLGFDASQQAIALAQSMARRLSGQTNVRFLRLNVSDPWPNETYDVVSLIDVMHHVNPKNQLSLLDLAATHVGAGGQLLYKDMAARPYWRAVANRVHDLVIARQWIHHLPIEDVIRHVEKKGLELEERRSVDILWYRHEIAVFRQRA
jgi:2-polyprenyl-3-methyl-5-hydroxy-6-metoxy-1,4-benzoquinol methylase